MDCTIYTTSARTIAHQKHVEQDHRHGLDGVQEGEHRDKKPLT